MCKSQSRDFSKCGAMGKNSLEQKNFNILINFFVEFYRK